jgi:hypothetical protein
LVIIPTSTLREERRASNSPKEYETVSIFSEAAGAAAAAAAAQEDGGMMNGSGGGTNTPSGRNKDGIEVTPKKAPTLKLIPTAPDSTGGVDPTPPPPADLAPLHGPRRIIADRVRRAREKGLSVRNIAAKYDLGLATVQRIVTA